MEIKSNMESWMFEPNMKVPPHIDKEVKITEEHIKKGKKGDALNCPIALALKEHIRPECDVLTTSKHALYYDRKFDRSNLEIVLGLGRVGMISLSEDAQEKIKAYQTKGKMTPFVDSFKIPLSIALTTG